MPPLPPDGDLYTSLWICGLLGKPIAIMSEPINWPVGHSLLLKTGLGRDVSPAYLFLLHWVKQPLGGWKPGLGVGGRPPFVESIRVPDAIPGAEQQGW